jgi:hypothetical protein
LSFDTLIRDMAGLAASIVSDTDLTYTKVQPGTYNPATGESTPVTATYSVRATKSSPRTGIEFAPGTVVQGGDTLLAFAAPSSWTPAPGDTVTLQGVVQAVVSVRPTWGGDVPVMYELLVRR